MSSGSSVYTIDTGKSRGTTFKIDTGGYVFSCLFDSGAEISCMNMETVATLGLMSQITPSSVSVNTANGDHMGVAGDVRVHFKIGRDTLIAYIKGEDASCEYLEVNEIIEDVRGINWQSPHTRKMVTSDLVYSPTQVTEHRHMELKDHDISEDTRRKFEEVKVQFPKVFSLNNEDIGHTQLVTMDIDTGDSPPICQKPYTLPLKHYNWVQQEVETLECAGVIRKSISPWAKPIVIVPKKLAPSEPPHRRMCIVSRKLNDLQPEVHCADSETGGNISLVPLPKIDEMYGRLKGAKYFTTLDL